MFGIYYAFSSQDHNHMCLMGGAYILVGAFLNSLYMVLSKRVRKDLPNGLFTFILNSGGFLIGLVLFFANSSINNITFMNLFDVGQFSWMILFLLALLPSILGHTLMIFSLPHFNLNFVSCLKLLSPISASALGIYFFNDMLSLDLIIGFFLVS
jgi:drug/metabolite transporter (DMT)-like permease